MDFLGANCAFYDGVTDVVDEGREGYVICKHVSFNTAFYKLFHGILLAKLKRD